MRKKIVLLSISALLPGILSFLSMLFYNRLHAFIGNVATYLYWVFPILAILAFSVLMVLTFKLKINKLVIPAAIVILTTLVAFLVIGQVSNSKISSDFLNNELDFINEVRSLKENNYIVNNDDFEINEGIFDISTEKLNDAVPTKKVQIIKIDEHHSAFLFIALQTNDRIEGYAYIPDGAPMEWNALNSEWSESLDINNTWYYICLYK